MHIIGEPEWVFWLILAVLFLAGLVVSIFAFAMDTDDVGKFIGCFIMVLVLIVGVSGYIDKQSAIKNGNEKELIVEKKELLERAETDRRMDLISEELELEESEVIVYETKNGLFNAETSEGKYLIEFDDAYEGIVKIIKTSN